MEITEAKVKLVSDKADKLKAFCTITIDREFVIRDIKIIKGSRGCFVAMPSRKLMDRCPSCGGKNHLRAAYCNECGGTLRQDRISHDAEGRAKLHADIAHPINSACRERLQKRVLEAYEKEVEASRRPGYMPASEDDLLAGTYEDAERPPARDREASAEAEQPPESRLVESVESSLEVVDTDPTGEDISPAPPPGSPKDAEADSFSSGIL